MKTIDAKSCLIGVLATALVAVIIGARFQLTAAPAAQRYQFATTGKSMLVYDTQSGVMSVVSPRFEKNGDFAWFTEDQFKLDDALTRQGGGVVTPGPGRHNDQSASSTGG